MPGIRPYYEPENKNIQEIADDERLARVRAIENGWQYYNGNHHRPLKVFEGERDDNIIINLVGGAIDKTVEFIGIPTLTLEGGTDNVIDPTGRVEFVKSPEQEALDMLVDASDLPSLIPDTLVGGAVSGHNFWRIVIDVDENGDYIAGPNNLPYLMLLDARHVVVFWDITNPKRVLYYQLQWQVGDEKYRQDILPGWMLPDDFNIGVRPLDSEWVILQYVMRKGKSKFEFESGAVWQYPFSPIVQFKNRRKPHSFYGESDMRDAGINDAYNFVFSNTGRIIKYHAHPRTIGTGMDARDVETTAIDGFYTVMNENAHIANLEMQSDLQSSMRMIEMLRQNFFSQMRVVDVSTIKDRLGQISNFGVRMMFDDMVKMIEDKRARYGDNGLGEAFRRMLAMLNIFVDGVLIEWEDPLPVDYRELVETIEKEQALGLTSKQTLAKDLGRDFNKEQDQIEEERNIETENRVNTIIGMAQRGINGQ